jgi:hypothetical protein
MSQSCPVSLKNIDSNIVRIVALQTAIIAVVFVLTKMPIFALVLLYDFAVRGLKLPQLSPFVTIAKIVTKLLKLKPKPTDEAPKRFALFIGLFMLVVINMLIFMNQSSIAVAIMIILIVCASLEAFFDYCVGCKVYWLIKKVF